MSLVINNNTVANATARHLNDAYSALSSSTEKMSSGLRINSAADDAAGLAVRELMRSDISTLQQGVRNANDGISMIQTADGALGVVDEKLIRMKELAEQAATGTYTSDQRALIDQEYQAMASEITRIASATDFNGIHLLNGNVSGDNAVTIHFGTGNDSAEDKYDIEIGTCTASALGIGNQSAENAGYTVSTQEAAQASLEALDNAIISKDKIRANLGALENRLEATISNLEIQGENLQAAESQISDVDVATEMTNYSKQQIITQSAVSMLAQANSLPQMALSLIG
ncbi:MULTISPECIES: flagellin [Maridesulfovibrio]|uniref:Flagellin n=1 Tax=Maridesulfovibrio salexigens (strain ATCC 14822 / DSM 2638 / NCIMB 8403 / VKM B-1763) TaxID=526222 RepID=C6BZU6_MARSD|nr:flagellin [Maridesulfovibrio salexigens]ACS79003.1 flagellin domain protein [Maridesulfovibrio salexigens DSM 2638]